MDRRGASRGQSPSRENEFRWLRPTEFPSVPRVCWHQVWLVRKKTTRTHRQKKKKNQIMFRLLTHTVKIPLENFAGNGTRSLRVLRSNWAMSSLRFARHQTFIFTSPSWTDFFFFPFELVKFVVTIMVEKASELFILSWWLNSWVSTFEYGRSTS